MKHYLDAAENAARAAGKLLRENFQRPQRVNAVAAHDIKLEIDVQAQELITQIASRRISHARALRRRRNRGRSIQRPSMDCRSAGWHRELFLRHSSFLHFHCAAPPQRGHGWRYLRSHSREMWKGQKGEISKLNGDPIHVSDRADLAEAVVSIGLAKTGETINTNFPLLQQMIHRVRKCRVLGSAALDLAYVACGRLDAYIETGISLWDIAAGWLLVENAGGTVDLRPREDMKDKYSIVASNGLLISNCNE